LREDGGLAEPGHAVQCLRAGAEGGDAQALDGRRVLVQQRDPLVGREPLQQVVDALVQRERGIAERQPVGFGRSGRNID
jgi:hypothetical protein